MIKLEIAGAILYYESQEAILKDFTKMLESIQNKSDDYFTLRSLNQFTDFSLEYDVPSEDGVADSEEADRIKEEDRIKSWQEGELL